MAAGGRRRVARRSDFAATSRERRARRGEPRGFDGNVEYDGRLVFVRVRFDTGLRRQGFGRREAAAASRPGLTTIPTADTHLMKILEGADRSPTPRDGRLERLQARRPRALRLSNRLRVGAGLLDDDGRRSEGLRNYLLKGGFIIFDDFRENDWYNLEEQMKRALPELRWVALDAGIS